MYGTLCSGSTTFGEITMGTIRIIKTPGGAASEHIKVQWVGVEMPFVSADEAAAVETSTNPKSPAAGGYIVRGEDAVQATCR
jgi:hypothetical protein